MSAFLIDYTLQAVHSHVHSPIAYKHFSSFYSDKTNHKFRKIGFFFSFYRECFHEELLANAFFHHMIYKRPWRNSKWQKCTVDFNWIVLLHEKCYNVYMFVWWCGRACVFWDFLEAFQSFVRFCYEK